MKYRTIYSVEAIDLNLDANDMVVFRNFYRNKKVAKRNAAKVSKMYPGCDVYVQLMNKSEHYMCSVDPEK